MSIPDTRDPSVFPLTGYSRLLRPAGMTRIDELVSLLPKPEEQLRAALGFIKHHLTMVEAITYAAAELRERLRDGSYAKVMFSCGVTTEEAPYEVRMIICFDDPSKSGLCYADREPDPTPLCTVRFDAFISEFTEALQRAVSTNA